MYIKILINYFHLEWKNNPRNPKTPSHYLAQKGKQKKKQIKTINNEQKKITRVARKEDGRTPSWTESTR